MTVKKRYTNRCSNYSIGNILWTQVVTEEPGLLTINHDGTQRLGSLGQPL